MIRKNKVKIILIVIALIVLVCGLMILITSKGEEQVIAKETTFLKTGAEDVVGDFWEFDAESNTLIINGNMNDYLTAPWNSIREDIYNVQINYPIDKIGSYAFYGCENLTSIEIPNSVTSIGQEAFMNCASLTTLEIPSSVTDIGKYAFCGCSGLTNIKILSNITKIEERVFQSCGSLTSIEIPNSVTSIGEYAFWGSGLTNLELPEGVTSIGFRAFYMCSDLTSIELPNTVTSIGGGAFSDCSSLTSIKLPSSITNIEEGVFDLCENLTIVEMPSSVTSIGDSAFSNCYSLTSIDSLKNVTSIGDSAFKSCQNLTSVGSLENVKSIGNEAFYSCYDLTNIGSLKNVTNIGDSAFCDCSSLTSIGSLENVTSIGTYAFCGCSITSIELPNSLTNMGDSAFSGCSTLTEIVLPESITSIGNGVFANCTNLESIEIPSSITSVGKSAFYGCSSLIEIKLPEGVTSIGDSAFSNCTNLEYVEIPKTVTSIGEGAFDYCNSLKIYGYGGTEAEVYATANNIKFVDLNIIEIKATPIKTEYKIGEELDLENSVIEVIYRDGTREEISMTEEGVSITGYDVTMVGRQTIVVEYRGHTTEFTVTVTNVIERIEAIPGKTEYNIGEELDLENSVIEVTYIDGTREEVLMTEEEVNVTGYDKTKVGEQTIIVDYKGYTAEFTVTVTEITTNDITGIEVIATPSKTIYTIGEEIDLSDGVILVIYENEETEEVLMTEEGVIITGYDATMVGEQIIVVEYKGYTDAFTVNVTSLESEPKERILVYNGEEQELVEAGIIQDGIMEYSLDNETFSSDIPTGKDAGNYTVYYRIVRNNDYSEIKEVITVINKAKATIENEPKGKELVNNDEEQELIELGSTKDGEIQYSLDGINYSVDIPKAKDIGSYKVYYKVVGDKNHFDTEVKSIYSVIKERVLGDVSSDSEINARDAKLVIQYFTGKVTFTEGQKEFADINKDGEINARDAKLIIQHFTGKISIF